MLTEKQQKYQHHRQVKFDKYEYLTCEKILPSDQSRKIKQANFANSLLVEPFEKANKNY